MFIGLSALVIGLLEVLKTADLKFDGVIGHSLGDTLCGLALGLSSCQIEVSCCVSPPPGAFQ